MFFIIIIFFIALIFHTYITVYSCQYTKRMLHFVDPITIDKQGLGHVYKQRQMGVQTKFNSRTTIFFKICNQKLVIYWPQLQSNCYHHSNKKILPLRLIHNSKSYLINNMDHMRISGNEPSPVTLS